MTAKQHIIMVACITFNLIVGNLILYFMWKDSFGSANGDSWFSRLNVNMSLSGICCYYILFTKVHFQKWSLFKLCLLSVAAWLATLFIGIFINMLTFWNQTKGEELIADMLSHILISFMFGICGTAMFSFVAVPMGLINTVWLVLFRK